MASTADTIAQVLSERVVHVNTTEITVRDMVGKFHPREKDYKDAGSWSNNWLAC